MEIVGSKLFSGAISEIKGEFIVPGDKSISHRALMLGALAKGVTEVEGFLPSQDCLSTAKCMEKLGAEIKFQEDDRVVITGQGRDALQEPEEILDAGNSGTTARLLTGILAGLPNYCVLTGDESLKKRPMRRIVDPLRSMGATIMGRLKGDNLPLSIQGKELSPISYKLPVASAQVKSALLLAGLGVKGEIFLEELQSTRDHTERMLEYLGVPLKKKGRGIWMQGGGTWGGEKIKVPGDISSAAFILVAGALLPGSKIVVKNVGVNPTRTGILEVLANMGAKLTYDKMRSYCGEPVADIIIEGQSKPLRGITIGGSLIPRLIDELPVIAVAASLARGETQISDAGELRVKESDRLSAITQELTKLGADIKELPDGLLIRGKASLNGGICHSHGDHRIAMAMAVAGIFAKNPVEVRDAQCIDISFPGFAHLW